MVGKTLDFKEYEKQWFTVAGISAFLLVASYLIYEFYPRASWSDMFLIYVGTYLFGLLLVFFLYQRVRIERVKEPLAAADPNNPMETAKNLRLYVSAKLFLNRKFLFPLLDFIIALFFLALMYFMVLMIGNYTFLCVASYGAWLKGADMMIS